LKRKERKKKEEEDNLFLTAPEANDEVEGGFLLNIVVGESATILQLLAGKNQALLVGGSSFNLPNYLLEGINRV